MLFDFEDRPSDSPFVERVWRNQTDHAGMFTSIANNCLQLCIWTLHGKTYATLRGPETKPSSVFAPANGDYLGIVFKYGTYFPEFPVHWLTDSDVTLPEAGNRSFWLKGGAWQHPTYDNVEQFVRRLAHDGTLVHDPVVANTLEGGRTHLSVRSVQRRFVGITGMTHGTMAQIDRARRATALLREGVAISDVVDQVGYSDQPHLNRMLKRYIGQTPVQIRENWGELSYLFKTPEPSWNRIQLLDEPERTRVRVGA